MRTTLLDQIIKRRKALGVGSSHMPLLAGINRQQYEKIEKGGNPSLVTLDKIAEGLDAELMLIPKEKLADVRRVLEGHKPSSSRRDPLPAPSDSENDAASDPWALIDGKQGSRS